MDSESSQDDLDTLFGVLCYPEETVCFILTKPAKSQIGLVDAYNQTIKNHETAMKKRWSLKHNDAPAECIQVRTLNIDTEVYYEYKVRHLR